MARILLSLIIALSATAALGQTALDDLRNWHSGKLAAFTVWHVDGTPPAFQRQQIEAGHRFMPVLRIRERNFNADNASNPTSANAHAETLTWIADNSLPLILRCNNVSDQFRGPDYRSLPFETSPNVWRESNGQRASTPIVDMFGPAEHWTNEGFGWATSPLLSRIRELVPAPPFWMLSENNEGADDKLGTYTYASGGKRPDGFFNLAWRSDAELAALSLRMRDRVRELRAADQHGPYDFFPEYFRLHVEPRRALWMAFDTVQQNNGWPAGFYHGYRGGFDSTVPPNLAAQHGPAPLSEHLHSGSPQFYVGNVLPPDFTHHLHWTVAQRHIPVWKWREARDPNAWRDISLSMPAAGALYGARTGRHRVITPELYGQHAAWLLWSVHKAGSPTMLRYWLRYNTPPDQLFYAASDHADLDRFGHPELKTATVWDYQLAVLKAVDDACTGEKREFLLAGERVDWKPASFKDGAVCQMFHAITKLPGKALVVTFSAVSNPTPETLDIPGIGKIEIDGKESSWIVEPPATAATKRRPM